MVAQEQELWSDNIKKWSGHAPRGYLIICRAITFARRVLLWCMSSRIIGFGWHCFSPRPSASAFATSWLDPSSHCHMIARERPWTPSKLFCFPGRHVISHGSHFLTQKIQPCACTWLHICLYDIHGDFCWEQYFCFTKVDSTTYCGFIELIITLSIVLICISLLHYLLTTSSLSFSTLKHVEAFKRWQNFSLSSIPGLTFLYPSLPIILSFYGSLFGRHCSTFLNFPFEGDLCCGDC